MATFKLTAAQIQRINATGTQEKPIGFRNTSLKPEDRRLLVTHVIYNLLPYEVVSNPYDINFACDSGRVRVKIVYRESNRHDPEITLYHPKKVNVWLDQACETSQVLEGEFWEGNIFAWHFVDGPWLDELAPKAQKLFDRREDNFSFINDAYLFPEYAHLSLNPKAYPMRYGGYHGKWRHGSEKVHEALQSIIYRHPWRGYQNYTDSRIKTTGCSTRRGGVLSLGLYIRAPQSSVNLKWRLVLGLDLRGGLLMADDFRPGKWMYYIYDLTKGFQSY